MSGVQEHNSLLSGARTEDVNLRSLLSGEDPTSGALTAGLFMSGYRITAGGVVTQLPAGSILESICVIENGTGGNLQLFDDTTNGSTTAISPLIASGSLTDGQVYKWWGTARRLNTGLFLTFPTGGAIVIVYGKPAA